MQFPPLPENEPERLQELFRYDVLNTQAEEDFDEIVKLASEICQVPISTITLIDSYRQWHKAKVGLEDQEGDRNITFCAHTILGNDLMEVPDATKDERFFDNPLVLSDPTIRFYAGMPMVSSNGYKIGTLCVIDRRPRKLSKSQGFALRVLAKQVIKLFDLRLKNKEIATQNLLIAEQKNKLTELSSIQNKIISIISHDIRGPIASLQNILSLQRNGILSSKESNELLRTAETQVGHTLSLLTSLVEWGAILRNAGQASIQPIRFYELLSEEIHSFQIAFRTKQNIPVIQVPQHSSVLSDRNMLRFIIRNLISNANKFTQNGTITIASQVIANEIKISISDTGIGMPAEISANLFNPDKRASRPGTLNESGNGLGLLLSREFAEKLGTALFVFSEPEQGTSVYFTLPLAPQS